GVRADPRLAGRRARLAGAARQHRDRHGAARSGGAVRREVRGLRLHPLHEPPPRRHGRRPLRGVRDLPRGAWPVKQTRRWWLRPWLAALVTLSAWGSALAQTEITFWYAWGGSEGQVIAGLIDEYNASQDDVRVRGSFVPIGDGERILASLAGGAPADLVTVWDWMVVPLGASGALLDLSDALAATGITAADYLPGIWEYGAYQGAKYGLPTTLNVYGFMWNKDVFEEA